MIFEITFPNFQQIVSKESNELARNPIYYIRKRGAFELYFTDGHWQFKTYVPITDIEGWYENEDNFRNEVLQHGIEVIGYD